MVTVGNNLSPALGLAVLHDTVLEMGWNSSSLLNLLDSFLLRGMPLLEIQVPTTVDFQHLAGYFQLIVEQAHHCMPLLPEWSTALSLSPSTLDQAIYDRGFHTLTL